MRNSKFRPPTYPALEALNTFWWNLKRRLPTRKICFDRPTWVVWANSQFATVSFLCLLYGLFVKRTGRTYGPILTIYTSRPTQPPTFCGTGNEYRPKCSDAMRLVIKGRMAHSIRGLMCGYMAGNMCDLVNTCFRVEYNSWQMSCFYVNVNLNYATSLSHEDVPFEGFVDTSLNYETRTVGFSFKAGD